MYIDSKMKVYQY